MSYNIVFNNAGRIYKLLLISGVTIVQNVEALADTAEIRLPEAVLNSPIQIEKSIQRGTKVVIELGYNGKLVQEFTGYVLEVQTNNSEVCIKCEDELFNFRFRVPDKQFKDVQTSEIVQYLIDEMDTDVALNCEYNIGYEKFTIYQATAYDVLKKIASETKANIYFDTVSQTLQVRFPYKDKGGDVIYNLAKNVESSALEFRRSIDRKVEVIIESTNLKGEVISKQFGQPGGDTFRLKVGGMSAADVQKIAEAEFSKRNSDRLEGELEAWLIPVVRPTFSAKIVDKEYPEKDGVYYVDQVTTSFSDGGGKRNVKLGVKLG